MQGADPKTYKVGNAATASSAPSEGGAPPPPPPPPPPPAPGAPPPPPPPAPAASSTTTGAGSSGGDMSSVFAQLNQGESVTKGLRHVDKSEMTHKNPELRTAGVVPTSCECSNSFPLFPLDVAAHPGVRFRNPPRQLRPPLRKSLPSRVRCRRSRPRRSLTATSGISYGARLSS